MTPDEAKRVMREVEKAQAVRALDGDVMNRLFEPWSAQLKTSKTNNIGIYNRVGECIATLDVHPSASEDSQKRRMREARVMAAGPDLLDSLSMLYAETADYIRLNNLGGMDNQCMQLARAALARADGKGSK